MSEDIQWKKISDKKYQRKVGEEWVSIDVFYGRVALIFAEFVGEGGMIDPVTGSVSTDLPTLISKFGTIGDILLTEYDAEGNVVKKGNCCMLSPSEVPVLFEIAVDIINSFTGAIQGIQGTALNQEASAPAPKKVKKA